MSNRPLFCIVIRRNESNHLPRPFPPESPVDNRNHRRCRVVSPVVEVVVAIEIVAVAVIVDAVNGHIPRRGHPGPGPERTRTRRRAHGPRPEASTYRMVADHHRRRRRRRRTEMRPRRRRWRGTEMMRRRRRGTRMVSGPGTSPHLPRGRGASAGTSAVMTGWPPAGSGEHCTRHQTCAKRNCESELVHGYLPFSAFAVPIG